MEYTKEQLIGLEFTQLEFTQCISHYIISSSDDLDGLKFHKPSDPNYFYTGYTVEKVNNMIQKNVITLVTTPNQEPQYEIY